VGKVDADGWCRCRACGAKLARRADSGLVEARHRHRGAAGIVLALTCDCGLPGSGRVYPAAEVLMVALPRARDQVESALT